MIRKLIFISVLVLVATLILVFAQTQNWFNGSEEEASQEAAYTTEEGQGDQWTRVDGGDYTFEFPSDWYWREYIDVDGVVVRFVTNDVAVEKLGQELSENQIAMSFWSDPNEIYPEALETMTVEEVNDRALESELEMAKGEDEISQIEKLWINGTQAVTYQFEYEGTKYRKYFLVNESRYSFVTAEYHDDNFLPTVKRIMESFELKRD